MLLTQIRAAARVYLKDKLFSGLNILGLAFGITVSMVLMLILQHDLTYDKHHVDHNRIYRLGCYYEIRGRESKLGYSARELSTILKQEYPEIEESVRIERLKRRFVRNEGANEKGIYEESLIRADPSYFKLFTHRFLMGNPETCLLDPHAVVLTASTAKKYFSKEDPLNQTLLVRDVPMKVTAVIEDVPENSHVRFNMLLGGLEDHRDWTINNGKLISEAFWNPDVHLYLKFSENYQTQRFLDRFPGIYQTYFREIGDKISGKYTPFLEPLADIHFYSGAQDEEQKGNLTYLYAFTVVGTFIILLACINYMNLATAKASARATEIAVKKVIGSGKARLVFAFLSESTILSVISYGVAILLVFVILDLTTLNQIIGKNLKPDFIHSPYLLFGSLGMTLCIGLLSGLYPAFYLPSIPAVAALKGGFKNRKSAVVLRKVLITTQFSISIFVVACTLFMGEQMDFVRSKDLGFTKENIICIPIGDTLVKKMVPAIKNELLQNPHILSVTTAEVTMGMDIGTGVMLVESSEGMKQQPGIVALSVGEDFIKTLGIKLVSGRDFQPGANVDLEGVYIANEAAVKAIGWGDDAIGKKVSFFHGQNPGKIVGIVKDFNTYSLHEPVGPMFILKAKWFTGYMQVKVSGEELPQSIDFIKSKWSTYDAAHPFEYFFLDQRFNEQYKADETQNRLLSILSFLCIFISLLGLIGLSAFMATQRTREIGVRKVLGANIPDIIFLLSKQVLFLVIVSSVLVVPFSHWAVSRWLETFAYQVELNYVLYIVVTLGALLFVFVTVLLQSLKVASSNPVDSLKYE